MNPAGTILVTALTYHFGDPCSSIAGSGCLLKLVQLCPAHASVLCKPLHSLGGGWCNDIKHNCIQHKSLKSNNNAHRKLMCDRMLVYIVRCWVIVQVIEKLEESHLSISHSYESCMYVPSTIRK